MERLFSSNTNTQNPNSSPPPPPPSDHAPIKKTAKHRTAKRAPASTTSPSTSATPRLSRDPQSVAARERRHRISERFKVLRSMVPGGSRLDTVSMLDEAIRYVTFLKAQISLHHHHDATSAAAAAVQGQDLQNYGVAPPVAAYSQIARLSRRIDHDSYSNSFEGQGYKQSVHYGPYHGKNYDK